MPTSMTTIERAFFLARFGECTRVDDLIKRLNREGNDGRQIQGRLLRKQLRDLIQEAISDNPSRHLNRRRSRQEINFKSANRRPTRASN